MEQQTRLAAGYGNLSWQIKKNILGNFARGTENI